MLGGVLLFEQRFVHVVGIAFTALILTENLMVAVEVKRWHPFMLLAQVNECAVPWRRIPRGRLLSRPTPYEMRVPLKFGRCSPCSCMWRHSWLSLRRCCSTPVREQGERGYGWAGRLRWLFAPVSLWQPSICPSSSPSSSLGALLCLQRRPRSPCGSVRCVCTACRAI
jgi:hypothetical protein